MSENEFVPTTCSDVIFQLEAEQKKAWREQDAFIASKNWEESARSGGYAKALGRAQYLLRCLNCN